MTDVELEASFRPVLLDFDAGVAMFLDLLGRLSGVPAFASGWEVDGLRLDADRAALVEALRKGQAGEGADAGFHFAIAETPRDLALPNPPTESYLAMADFDRVQGALKVKLSMVEAVATLETILGIIKHLNDWSDLQHVSAVTPFYVPYDSPVDHVLHLGIGWAGWVPFALTPSQLPQAGYLEPLGQGTFVASQQAYWDAEDRAAVARAQALESGLDALGLLPASAAIRQGTWGQTP